MAKVNRRARPGSGYVFAWIALGFVVNGCVAKPPFHCQSDDACVAVDGSRGTCEASGECTFHSALSNPGGAGRDGGAGEDSGVGGTGGVGASTAGSANADGGTSSGGGGHAGSAGEPETAGAAGASCTDDANNCYTCTPQTSAEFLNACTSSGCVRFDDHARLTKLTPSGELPPLPPAVGQ